MGNTFDSKGGEQNVGQGDHAIGQQVNATQEVSGGGNILSGTGNVTVNNHGVPLKPKTVVIGSVLAAAVLGASLVGWHWLAPPPANNSISIQGNQNSGPTAIAQGTGATVTQVNNSGVPPALFAEYTAKLAVTDSALVSFFKIIEQEKVPPGDLDSKLREIATQYKELLHNWETVQSADPQVVKLKAEAKQAIEAGDYTKAETLLEDVANQHSLAAAEAHADNARLQEVQLRYAKAAAYWQKAAALLPDDKKKDRSLYLSNAGCDLYRIAKYKEALPLFEQSLVIRQEIGDRAGEGTTLNNISQIYHDRGDCGTALKYLEQSLVIHREIGNRAGEGTTLNNISQIYKARGDYGTALKQLAQSLVISRDIGDRAGEGVTLSNIGQIYSARGEYGTALKYLEQSLVIRRGEIGDRAGEGVTLNNISQIYDAKGEYGTALKYLERSLVIFREIGDRRGEAVTSWNIGRAYEDQGDLTKAEQYMARTVQLDEEIERPELEWERKALAALRTKLKAQ